MSGERARPSCRVILGLTMCLLLANGLAVDAQRRSKLRRAVPTQRSLQAQAQTEAEKLVPVLFTKCGDSYYPRYGGGGLNFVPMPPDSLNGAAGACS